jgi:carboxylate-amine ligase
MLAAPALTVGIEEEYLLVNLETRDLINGPPPGFLDACQKEMPGQVTTEFLQSQIEVGTKPYQTVVEAGRELAQLRKSLSGIAARHGIAPIAASTHPFANWRDQKHTDQERYDGLAKDLGGAVERLLICGMHVHVGIEDEDLRIDLLNQVSYFLPHILALSSSSPFWQGKDTMLSSYRLTVFDALPRTGLPDNFDSYAQYKRFVSQLVEPGLIEDATKIWWDIRPSDRYPTVEMRISDVCTRLDDALCIASLYQCLMLFLYRLRNDNQRWRIYPRALIQENRWRAQRYGTKGTLVDFGLGRKVPFKDLIVEIVEMVREDAEQLNCVDQLEHALTICKRGSSADMQREAFSAALADGKSEDEALRAIVDVLIRETVPD